MAKWSNEKPTKLPKKKSKLPTIPPIFFYLLGLIILISIIISIFFYKPKVVLTNNVNDVTLSIDGKVVKDKTINLSLGKHRVVLTAPGYIPNIIDENFGAFKTLRIDQPLRPIPSAKALVSESAFAADFSNNNKIFFYLGNGGKTLYRTTVLSNGDVKRVAITPDVLPSIEKVLFSPDFSVAIFKKTDDDTGMYDFKRYDLLNQTYESWGKDIGSVTWSPDSTKIAYYYAPHTVQRSLVISDKTHQSTTILYDLNNINISAGAHSSQAPKLYWSPNGKTIAIVSNGDLHIIDVASRFMNSVATGGITDFQYSPDNKYILYTQGNHLVWQEIKPVDALADPKDKNLVGHIRAGEPQTININAQASKAVFNRNQSKIVALTKDNGIKQIDIKTLTVKPFYLKDDLSKVSDLGLSADDKTLYALDGVNLLNIPLDLGKY